MTGVSMPSTEQGSLAPTGRSDDQGEFSAHSGVHAFRESRACYHIEASRRHIELRREEGNGWCLGDRSRRNSIGRLRPWGQNPRTSELECGVPFTLNGTSLLPPRVEGHSGYFGACCALRRERC